MTRQLGISAQLTVILLLSANGIVAALRMRPSLESISTQTPTSTATLVPNTGILPTSLEQVGHAKSLPFVTTTVTSPLPSLATPLATPAVDLGNKVGGYCRSCRGSRPPNIATGPIDPFQVVGTGPVPNQFKTTSDHPIPRLNIIPQRTALQTNKFYANFFLGDQRSGTWTHPYSLTWSKGGGPLASWGMAITHLENSMKAFGPRNNALPGSPAAYFINPIGIQHIVLSAAELGNTTTLSSSNLEMFSANAVLRPSRGDTRSITYPMVQGMGFVTAIYSNLTPLIQTGMAITQMTPGSTAGTGIFKYTISANDGSTWMLYVVPNNGQDPRLTLASTSTITGPAGFSGIIQIAKNPTGAAGAAVYDACAGVYATSATLSGSVDGATGSYSITWKKAGATDRKLLMWALPHHVNSFSSQTAAGKQRMVLSTTTKGNAAAVIADSWTFVETNLPTTMAFGPWDPATKATNTTYSRATLQTIADAAISELNQDMIAQTNLNSMYYAGKALAKFATIIYVANDILKNDTLVTQGLRKLETAFSLFTTNQQQFPLVYESAWGGVVSSASYINGDLGADFGNTAYNDHHFHYGYFIYAAAVIGYLDPTWLSTSNRAWVNALVRDAANPSPNDTMFPQFRNFDWYHGHSWAHGLFASYDSKDEESSSEDTNFAYAIKMWGRTSGDASMEARGNLMLAVLARSLQSYMLYTNDNNVMPQEFIGNKVSGILFENKVDHTTYFGANLEYIQGIHMLPILPHSAFIRSPTFVAEEWTSFFADNAVVPAKTVRGGWKGILYSNLALWDAKASWKFFSSPGFDMQWVDGGASRTWYLAYAAGRGGAS